MNEYDGFVALRVTLFLLFPCSWVIGGGGLAANNGGELYPLVVADVVYLIYISLYTLSPPLYFVHSLPTRCTLVPHKHVEGHPLSCEVKG